MSSYWRDYWEKRCHGGHRWQSNEFLQKEAKEKLFHLAGGETLLDFGCGSADLLRFYAEAYPRVVGVDFSLAMLAKARDNLEARGLHNVALIHADDASVWETLPEAELFDRITMAAVSQFLNEAQLRRFVEGATKRLTSRGKVILFDVIDPRLYWLIRVGAFRIENGRGPSWPRLLRAGARELRGALGRRFRGLPAFDIGYGHHPGTLDSIARSYGLQMEYVCSMYYEYRYHAVLIPETPSRAR